MKDCVNIARTVTTTQFWQWNDDDCKEAKLFVCEFPRVSLIFNYLNVKGGRTGSWYRNPGLKNMKSRSHKFKQIKILTSRNKNSRIRKDQSWNPEILNLKTPDPGVLIKVRSPSLGIWNTQDQVRYKLM